MKAQVIDQTDGATLKGFVEDKELERAAKALLSAGKLPEHKQSEPTKAELKKRFVMRTDRYGKPVSDNFPI